MKTCAQDGPAAVICDRDGRLLRFLRDDMAISSRYPPGTPLAELATPGSRESIHRFLRVLQAGQAACEPVIEVQAEGGIRSLTIAGSHVDEGFLVVMVSSASALERLSRELMLVNNEQTNALRAALKDLSLTSRGSFRNQDGIYDDLTRLNNELTNLQREMVKKNVELARLDGQKNRFLGMAAHDLASPLGVILNYAEFLEAEADLSDEHLDFVVTIRETCRFMLTLVQDLLDVSAIEEGRLELALESTDMVALVEEAVRLNRVLAARKRIEIGLAASSNLPSIDADPRRMIQVLNNLIGNAVKFSDPGSRVEVSVEREGDTLVVAVADDGPGIAPEDIDRLFMPFERRTSRGTAGEPGTGLGLAIARRIVEGHRGTITVESQPRAGSIFRVRLQVTPRGGDSLQPPLNLVSDEGTGPG